MRILSIDWDYFFPDDTVYDWGHQESPFFINMLWNFRTNTRAPNGKLMLDTHVPTIPKNFWKKVLTNKPGLFVAESHCDIWHMIENLLHDGPVEIVNLDAHHDCGYAKITGKVPDTFSISCGSWGYWGLRTYRISLFFQHYPAWRKDRAEGFPGRRPSSISYDLPEPADYDAVFLCRSGAWTPPWHDDQFQRLIKSSRLEPSRVLAPRELNLRAARQMGQQQENMQQILKGVPRETSNSSVL
jgi:hypothetical protein